MSLPPSSPAGNENENSCRDDEYYSDDEQDVPRYQYQQDSEPNYVEEDEEDNGNDFEEEDGFVVDDGRVIQEHLKQQELLQHVHEEDEPAEMETGQVNVLTLEPRVSIAVALKIVSILRKNGILDGEGSGLVKDKIFGGDQGILRAVENFTVTHNVERLVSIIHGMSF